MRLPPLWPDIVADWIVFEDEHLVVVDKPAGVSCQASDPSVPDDLVSRLRAFLAERDGASTSETYLGVHQRLDQETSGLVVYAKTRDANPGLARQFEARLVRKGYLACVEGGLTRRRGGEGPRAPGRARGLRRAERRPRSTDVDGAPELELRDHVLPPQRGLVTIASQHDRRARLAVTRARSLREQGERVLLALQIETGRTHQIRVQLAHRGAPIVGDRLYGGSPHRRLLLHASSLAFDHPLTGRPLAFESPLPQAMEAWLAGRDVFDHGEGLDQVELEGAELEGALDLALERRWRLGRSADFGARAETTAFRWVNGEGDGLPGLAVDLYGGHLLVHLYDAALERHLDTIVGKLIRPGIEDVYVKRRPRQANTLDAAETKELAPERPYWRCASEPATASIEASEGEPDEIEIVERGIAYRARLGEGLSTGIFLDQRDNRERVREHAEGATVLNLFAYTCAFTVAAIVGGARRSLSVDASARALARGREALARLHASEEDHALLREDVFAALERLGKRGQRFDLLIADPPTYASTRRGRWTSGSDWTKLAAALAAVSSASARWLVCSNDRRMSLRQFRDFVRRGLPPAIEPTARLRELPPPIDFRSAAHEEAPLKSLWVELGARRS